MFHSSKSRSRIATSFVLVMSTATDIGAQEYRYAFFELPSLIQQDQFTPVGGISAYGDVVGGAAIDPVEFHATLWPSTGGVIDLGTLGGDSSGAAAINEFGEIAGWSNFEPGGSIFVRHAVIWRGMEMVDLGTLGGESSFANGMNNVGQVVGQSEYEFGNFASRAFFWENGRMLALRAPRKGWFGGAAFDINDLGYIVGAGLGGETQATGTLWIDQQPIDLGSLSGRGSTAYAINDLGVIVGLSQTAQEDTHAVMWVDRQIVDIHTPQIGVFSVALDINNVGQVVGYAGNNGLAPWAFIRDPGQPMRRLNDLAPPRLRLPWRIDRADGINDAGQIAAEAKLPNNFGDIWGVLLSPVAPSVTLATPQPGRAGEANRLRVTGCTPGARVHFLYSRHGGGQRIPGCDLQQNALQLDSPTVIGTAIADGNGVASITRTVPPIARGQTILFQAVVQNECAISQLVVHRFE
ncbi:MAG: hypothetical protein KJZ69_05470 [Phycisphaerales bacterium]|nr:hypothetical protein [Phycisphaerales bacterium]